MTPSALAHPLRSSEGLARRAAREKLAAMFGIDPDVRTWTPEQVTFGQHHGFLPTGRDQKRQAPRALSSPTAAQTAAALRILGAG